MERRIDPDVLRAKLADSLAIESPAVTQRDLRLPGIPGKPLAIIGVRRGGKTSFLHQLRAQRLAEGRPPESQVLLGLEDERLHDMHAADLGWIVEEHGRQYPEIRQKKLLSLYLDEVQVVESWETLVHRLVEARDVEIVVSGSSAKLLGQEIATSLRGRMMSVRVFPFSFREALRHAGDEAAQPWDRLRTLDRAAVENRLREYLEVGGFPEAQGAVVRDRANLLQGYVDSMVLRDVIERHEVRNPTALSAMVRHLLSTPGGSFTVQKFYDSLRSQGVQVAKDTLHEFFAFLEDAFLVRVLSLHSASERQRMVNPRKVYPIDPGLIPLYARPGRTHHGRALETAVMLELERREYTLSWLKVDGDREVDFFATRPGDSPLLVQVCLDTSADETWAREVSALEAAAKLHPDATPLLITHDASPPARRLPRSMEWMPAAAWFLA